MVVKIIELVGASPTSWEEATKNAVTKAQESVKDIKGVDAVGFTAVVKDGGITEYHANVKIAFVVE
ncbi:MAG: dodecin family protein [Nitrosopumilaceae archaeon]